VCDWENIDVIRQNKYFRRFDGNLNCIVYPNSQAELAEVVAALTTTTGIYPAAANLAGWTGVGVDLVVSTERLNSVHGT